MPYYRLREDVNPKETILVSTIEQMLLLDILKEARKISREVRELRKQAGVLPPPIGDPPEEGKSGLDGSGTEDEDSGD